LLGHLLHDGAPALEGLVIPAFLDLHQVHDVVTVFDQFWEVRGEVIDLLADDVGQRARHVQVAHGPQCATDEHAGEVSLAYVADGTTPSFSMNARARAWSHMT
jgi:hypothetical protein